MIHALRSSAVPLGCALLVAGLPAAFPAGALAGSAATGSGAAGTGSGTGGTTGITTPPTPKLDSAALQECVTSGEASERSATFAGEMSAVAGTAKMMMRIDVLERLPRELTFHLVNAPGLGVWRSSAPGVKLYKDLKEVTNLTGPATYRAEIHFRWLNAKGRQIKTGELRTPRCQQPAPGTTPPAEEAEALVAAID